MRKFVKFCILFRLEPDTETIMGRKLLTLTIIAMALTLTTSCRGDGGFWSAADGKFIHNGETGYFIGANMWYAPLLASDTDVADPERLGAELDCLK